MSTNFPPLGDLPNPPGTVPPGVTPPGPSAPAQMLMSYSDKMKLNLKRSELLKRKLLEITVASKGNFKLEEEDVAKLMTRLGVDPVFQICPGNSRKILIWLTDSCDIFKYCKDESFRINETVRTGVIRPMDRKEVTVTIKGLNFNTPDNLVIDYLSKHGNVISDKVIYETAFEGPFKGIKNGNRKYSVDFSKGINLGSYHILDGAKIEIRYPGQRRTCGRCHQTSSECLGNGIGKTCQENGGEKVKLMDFMIDHWKKIGFSPAEFKLDDILDNENDVEMKETEFFTPTHKKYELSKEEISKFTGVLVKNIPIALPNKDICDILFTAGAPETSIINISKTEGGHKASVEINDLKNDDCLNIVKNLNGKMIHGNKVFCKGSSDLYTPKKSDTNVEKPDLTENVDNAIEPLEEALTDCTSKNPTKQATLDNKVIPGLPPQAQTLSRSQLKKLRKQISKSESYQNPGEVLDMKTQKALEYYKLNDFDFSDNSDEELSATDKLEKKRGRGSPEQDERRIKKKN